MDRLYLLLALGIDGPNVSKSFKSKFVKELQKRGATRFLDVGKCSIHKTNNAFLEGIKYLKDNVNVDQLLPFTNAFHSRYQKSKIPKKRRVFTLSGFLLPVFFLYLM